MGKAINQEYAQAIYDSANQGYFALQYDDEAGEKPVFKIQRMVLNQIYFDKSSTGSLQRSRYNQISRTEHGFIEINKSKSWYPTENLNAVAKRDIFVIDAKAIFEALGKASELEWLAKQQERENKFPPHYRGS